LRRENVPLIMNPSLSIVPIMLESEEEAEQMQQRLLSVDDGYAVGRVCIRGQNYETNGIRLVFTPRVDPAMMQYPASRLVKRIAEMKAK
jgi:hypothetical protein